MENSINPASQGSRSTELSQIKVDKELNKSPEKVLSNLIKEGYQPYEILEAARNSIIHEREVRIAE